MPYTFHDLQCFDAVVRTGSFQAAAELLHRSHPAVFASVGKLERQLGFALFDRSGYRVKPTEAGQAFHRQAQPLLREMEGLKTFAEQLAMGKESDLRVVIGDICPRPALLALLGEFFAQQPGTRLHLHFEAVGGPLERLLDGEADLIFHGVDKNDQRLEWVDLQAIRFVPVAAPGFLSFPVTDQIRPEQLRGYTQCVIRDTARHSAARDYYLVEGAQQCTVADQTMKKEIIVQGMAWGHLPHFLIEDELREGRLLSLAGEFMRGSVEELVAVRRRDRPHGPVANQLWHTIRERLPQLHAAAPISLQGDIPA